MPKPKVSIHPDLLMTLMYGSPGGQRFTQDTPVLPEVWLQCAEHPGDPVECLIVPHMQHQAHHVASEIYDRLCKYRKTLRLTGKRPRYGISDLPGLVTIRCHFDEIVNVVLPLTSWWVYDGMADLINLPEEEIVSAVGHALDDLKNQGVHRQREEPTFDLPISHLSAHFKGLEHDGTGIDISDGTVRMLLVLGVMMAAQQGLIKVKSDDKDQELIQITDLSEFDPDVIGKALTDLLRVSILRDRNKAHSQYYKQQVEVGEALQESAPEQKMPVEEVEDFDFRLVFTLSLNRKGGTTVFNSVPTTKADASRRLFKLSEADITWAVIDSGVDATHYAFHRYKENFREDPEYRNKYMVPTKKHESRVRKRFKMAIVKRLRDRDEMFNTTKLNTLAKDIASYIDLPSNGDAKAALATVKKLLGQVKKDLQEDRPLDWDLVMRLISVRHNDRPISHHGTHVAGTLGGRWPAYRRGKEVLIEGMCPEINIYDFNVMDTDIRATEFATVSALRLIRHLNERNDYKVVHGANLSLAFPHDVTNYACGQTPVCTECETLVNNGVVVVAAAGNVGYNVFVTKAGNVPLHTETSIADPGNADSVITVGSTHRLEPHTYGVSYFSSRGPTGDGRMKPDIVAPGEKITAPICNGEFATLEGTSMAAPHVSGAAALLMARFPELIGNPRRIKQILCDTATDLNRERAYQGHGLVDVLRALQSV